MLTNREKEVTQLAANGLSAKEISRQLGISKRTVEAHLKASRIKLKANNTSHLISIAHRSGIITALFLSCTFGSTFSNEDVLRPSRARGRMTRMVRQSRGKREWEIIG